MFCKHDFCKSPFHTPRTLSSDYVPANVWLGELSEAQVSKNMCQSMGPVGRDTRNVSLAPWSDQHCCMPGQLQGTLLL